jgi:chemotaxis protein MotB
MQDLETEHADRSPQGRASPMPWVLFAIALLSGAAASAFLVMKLASARNEASAATDAQERGRAERAELARRLEKVEAERADLLALRNELSIQVQAKEEELARLQATYQELESKMKEEIARGDVRLSQAGGRIKVDLVDKILFEVGDASITAHGEEVLSRVGGVLVNVADRKIQVSGHTDDQPISERLRGRYPTNWELASARASNVVRFLEEKARVPGRRLVAAAYGPWEPISSNRTATGRARNRRIEIVLTPALAPAPASVAKVAAEGAKKPPPKVAAAPAKTAVVKASSPAKGSTPKRKPRL